MKRSAFLDHVREVIRTNHFSYSTEKTYVNWIYRFIVFHNRRHPKELGGKEIADFLTNLAVEKKVSLDNFEFKHARIGKRLPIVLSRDETHRVISNLQGEFHLMASILYGSGLRLSECLNLRIKDIDYGLNEMIVRGGKGDNDRRTILPRSLIPQLNIQIEKVRIRLEENMLLPGFKGASMPEALERKYPNAPIEPVWQYLFPARKPALDPRTGNLKQHFRHESYLQKAVKAAIRKSHISKMPPVIRSGILLPPIFLRMVMIFALFRSY